MLYTCKCCLESREIANDEEFDQLDWEKLEVEDKEPEIYCNLCPAFYCSELAAFDHSEVHNTWKAFGRPEEFSVGSCLLQQDKKEVSKIERLAGLVFDGVPLSEKRLVSSALTSVHFNDREVNQMLDKWANHPLIQSIW